MSRSGGSRAAAHAVVGIGELLWDLLPGGRQVGGAPVNLVYHASRIGDRGVIASCVGTDTLGGELVARLEQLGVDCSHVQRDPSHPTGTVAVELAAGQPSYTLFEQVAYDFPALTAQWQQLAARADAVCYGTLAQRTAAAHGTICDFVAATAPSALRMFDVNLRAQFWSPAVLERSLQLATAVKLSDEELPLVAAAVGSTVAASQRATLAALAARYDLQLACLTRGAAGCLLLAGDTVAEEGGVATTVADTVGAGDAFSAVVVHHYLRGHPLQRSAAAANRYAAFVAGCAGGTPQVPDRVAAQARAE